MGFKHHSIIAVVIPHSIQLHQHGSNEMPEPFFASHDCCTIYGDALIRAVFADLGKTHLGNLPRAINGVVCQQ